MSFRLKRKQRGLSLLEVMFSFTIITIILLMAVRYYLQDREYSRVHSGTDMVNGVAAAEAQYSVNNPGTGVASIETLTSTAGNSTSYLPSGWGDGTAANPWGGALSVAAGTSQGAGGFTVTMTGLSNYACTNMPNMLVKNTSSIAKCAPGSGVITVEFP